MNAHLPSLRDPRLGLRRVGSASVADSTVPVSPRVAVGATMALNVGDYTALLDSAAKASMRVLCDDRTIDDFKNIDGWLRRVRTPCRGLHYRLIVLCVCVCGWGVVPHRRQPGGLHWFLKGCVRGCCDPGFASCLFPRSCVCGGWCSKVIPFSDISLDVFMSERVRRRPQRSAWLP